MLKVSYRGLLETFSLAVVFARELSILQRSGLKCSFVRDQNPSWCDAFFLGAIIFFSSCALLLSLAQQLSLFARQGFLLGRAIPSSILGFLLRAHRFLSLYRSLWTISQILSFLPTGRFLPPHLTNLRSVPVRGLCFDNFVLLH